MYTFNRSGSISINLKKINAIMGYVLIAALLASAAHALTVSEHLAAAFFAAAALLHFPKAVRAIPLLNKAKFDLTLFIAFPMALIAMCLVHG